MMLVFRMTAMHGANWDTLAPAFSEASAKDIEAGKAFNEVKAKLLADGEALKVQAAKDPTSVIHPASEVKPENRKNMFWVADKEQAEAWLKYHQIVKPDAR